MAKGGVLGNDPFRRGAAARDAKDAPPGEQVTAPEEPAPKTAKKQQPKKQRASKARTSKPAEAPPVVQDTAPTPEADLAPEAPTAAPEPSHAGRAWSESTGGADADAWEESTDDEGVDEGDWIPEEADPTDDGEGALADGPPRLEAERAREADREASTYDAAASGGGMATPLLSQAVTALTVAKNLASHTLRSEAVTRLAKVADGVFSAVMTAVGASGATAVDEYGKDLELARKVAPIADFLYDRYWRVSLEGAELIPAGGVILVANHSGAIPVDGYMLHQALRRHRPDLAEPRWLAEDQIFHAPFLGTLYNRLGAVRASPENALRLLREGRPVITFPEGIHGIRKPFGERYQLKRLGRGGFAKIAIRERAPILPVAIVGGEESSPLLAKLPGELLGLPYVPVTLPPLPARWFIRIGQPISIEGLPVEAADDLLQVQRVVEKTRQSIEGMLRAILDDRRSVFGG